MIGIISEVGKMNFKGLLLDWIGDLNELVEAAGPSGAISILTLVALVAVIVMFTKRMQSLTDAIIILTNQVSAPYLEPEESLIIFRSIMRDHVWTKLEFIGNTLEHNHIRERENQIKKNIEREFKRITTMEAEKLSKFKTKCGDMGETLLKQIDWKKFLAPVYEIFFSEDEIPKKITDIHGVMNEWVDRIASIIYDAGTHN